MNSILEVYEQINSCEKCQLYKQRITDYIYRGNKDASIVLIGEAPGEQEQKGGTFFIGRSGKLLDKMLEKVGLDIHNDVYITNIVKDRPPDNRKPFYDEIIRCENFLKKEIEIINPKLITTLGKTSADWFSGGNEYKINTYYQERKWIPLYHPSYLLRRRDYIEPWIKALKQAIELTFN
jgi:uracil-DNA glycosylase